MIYIMWCVKTRECLTFLRFWQRKTLSICSKNETVRQILTVKKTKYSSSMKAYEKLGFCTSPIIKTTQLFEVVCIGIALSFLNDHCGLLKPKMRSNNIAFVMARDRSPQKGIVSLILHKINETKEELSYFRKSVSFTNTIHEWKLHLFRTLTQNPAPGEKKSPWRPSKQLTTMHWLLKKAVCSWRKTRKPKIQL